MTKAEWRTTCRRVADERGRFVAEQQSRDTLPNPTEFKAESPGRSYLRCDSAHGRDCGQDQELSWETRMAGVARNALRPI